MEAELLTLLKEYGLDEREIKVYLHLVGNKKLTAYKIAKDIRIHRSTCYDILDRLMQKGFVSKIERQNKSFYFSNEASKILATIIEKETILNNIMPKLQILENKQATNVKFLENPHAQNEFDVKLLQLLRQNKLTFFYMIGGCPVQSRPGQMLLIERLIKEAKKLKFRKKIDYRGLWDVKFKGSKFGKLFNQLGENKFLKGIPAKTTIIIFDGHVAFLYTIDTAGLIEIKNPLISEEMMAYFNFLWKLAKK